MAQLLYSFLNRAGLDYKLIAADFIDETGSSKIGRLHPSKVVELGTGPGVHLAKNRNDLNATLKYWDKLGVHLLAGGTVIDMGANVVDQILDWSRARRTKDIMVSRNSSPIEAMLVCRAEQRAVDDLGDLIRRFGQDQSLPVERITVVMNEFSGNFENIAIQSRLSSIPTECEVNFVTMPRCTSELWPSMEARYVSVDEALDFTSDEAMRKLEVDLWSATSGVDDLKDWYQGMYRELKSNKIL